MGTTALGFSSSTIKSCSTIKLNIARKSPDEEVPVSIRGTLLSRKSLTASSVSHQLRKSSFIVPRNHRDLQLNANSQQSDSETLSDTNSQAEMPLTDLSGHTAERVSVLYDANIDGY